MDDFIEKLEDYLKNNKVSKKRNLGQINIIDDQGNYLIDDRGKLSKLEKPDFSKDNDHKQIDNTFHYLRNKLMNLHTSRTNNYFNNYPLEDIKHDQQKLKESVGLLNKIKEEEELKNKEILDMSTEIKNVEVELIKLYNTTNFGEKEQIKKYLQLKMKFKDLQNKEILLKKKLSKKVTIRDFKVSEIETLKIEYLNTKKVILTANRIKSNPKKKLNYESSNSLKKTQKKTMEGGGTGSILKKKGSIKNIKNISWGDSLPDGTPIIDNSFSDLTELNDTTNIDLSSISKELDNQDFNLDLSDIQIIDNDDNLQLGGNSLNDPELININLDSDVSNPDENETDNTYINENQYGGEIDIQTLKTNENSFSDLNISSNINSVDENSTQLDIDTLKETNIINKNEDIIDFENKNNDNITDLNTENNLPILSSQSGLIGGSNQSNSKNVSSTLSVEDISSDVNDDSISTMDDDNIMISIDDDNNVNIIEKDLDSSDKEFINNDDIKIISLK